MISRKAGWIAGGAVAALVAGMCLDVLQAEYRKELFLTRQQAAIPVMKELYRSSGGRVERLTPAQRKRVEDFLRTGLVPGLPGPVPGGSSPVSGAKTPLDSRAVEARVKAIYRRTGGQLKKLTAEEKRFLASLARKAAFGPGAP